MGKRAEVAVVEEAIKRVLDGVLAERLVDELRRVEENKTPSMAIVASGGTLETGYLPFILSATAAALGWNASVFFMLYGLRLLTENISDSKVCIVGNPAMPLAMTFGPQWFRSINWRVPNAIRSTVPGFEAAATSLMKRRFKDNGVATLTELRDLCVDSGVRFVVCQMSADMLGFTRDEFIAEVTEYAGAATFLAMAKDADVCLFL